MTSAEPDFPLAALKKEPASEKGAATMTETTRLMLAVKAGDGPAFAELEQHLRGRAFRIAHALVGSREDALDLAQETFLKVFRARETFREGEPFLPWFHRILRNTCFSFLRERGRLRARSLSAGRPGADEDEADFDLADDEPGPAAGLLSDERAEAFRAAFATLSARDREIITLRHFQDLSYRQIADSLGIPQGTVMSRLFHARRRLREKLAGVLDEEGLVDEDRPRAAHGDL